MKVYGFFCDATVLISIIITRFDLKKKMFFFVKKSRFFKHKKKQKQGGPIE